MEFNPGLLTGWLEEYDNVYHHLEEMSNTDYFFNGRHMALTALKQIQEQVDGILAQKSLELLLNTAAAIKKQKFLSQTTAAQAHLIILVMTAEAKTSIFLGKILEKLVTYCKQLDGLSVDGIVHTTSSAFYASRSLANILCVCLALQILGGAEEKKIKETLEKEVNTETLKALRQGEIVWNNFLESLGMETQ
jgi:hypothetical protein